jgi:hypothetical protein
MILSAKNRLRMRVLWELLRYDVLSRVLGFAGIRRRMQPARQSAATGTASAAVDAVCQAVACMTSFYWKPLLCLQRSIVTARVLRAGGIQADVVIGYRAYPFFSHAWVEVGGRVVNDSSAYQYKLQLLDRF